MTSPAGPAGAASSGGGTGGQGTGGQEGAVQPDGQRAGGQGGTSKGSQQQGTGTGGTPASGGQGPDNGLYAEFLRDIPTQLHPTLIERLKANDARVTQQQQSVRSQYAAYQPLIDAGADPQQLAAAHEFVQYLGQNDPEAVLQEMAEAWGIDLGQLVGGAGGQQQAGQGGMADEGLSAGPGETPGAEAPPQWFTQFQQETFGPIQEIVNLMAQAQVQQHQSQQSEQEITQLEQLLESKGIPLQDGDPQLGFVLGQLALGDDENTPTEQLIDAALEQWNQFRSTIGGQAASAQAPRVMPAGGGGLPTQQIDPASLSQKDRRALAVQRAKQLMAGG